MKRSALIDQIKQKSSFLCVGLDIDLEKIPTHLLKVEDPLFSFSKAIVDATAPFAVAFKPNIAFFEAYGSKGWISLEKLISYINTIYPEIFTIADAKRGDIGNTAARYAKAFFEFTEKQTVLLGLTSNPSAADFQYHPNTEIPLYKKVLKASQQWKNSSQLMYVVGATKSDALKEIRRLLPDSFLLVPGLGAQGGSLQEVAEAGLNQDCGLLVNSSRSILYASQDEHFAQAAAEQAQSYQKEMQHYLSKINLL